MPIDISMYGTPPVRSVLDYQNDYLKNDLGRQQLQANALAFQQQQSLMAEKRAMQNLLMQGKDPNKPEDAPLFLQAAPQAFPAMAHVLAQTASEQANVPWRNAQAREHNAKADVELLKKQSDAWKMTTEKMPLVQSLDDFNTLLLQAHQMGAFGGDVKIPMSIAAKAEQASKNPADWAKFLATAQQTGSDVKDQIANKMKQFELASKTQNELMVPKVPGDYTGEYVPNEPLAQIKKDIAQKGASQVSVKVDTKFGEGVAGQVGPMLRESHDAAAGAQLSSQNSDRIIRAIDTDKVLAGPGATFKLKGLQIGQILGVTGKDSQDVLLNTRAVIQGLAKATLANRASLKGQGQVSDFEGRLLEKADSGNIDDMTASEIKQIMEVNKRLAKQLVDNHNAFVKKVQARPETASLANMFELNAHSESIDWNDLGKK
jgi:hypothetical protein